MIKTITVMSRKDAVKYTKRKHVDDKAAMLSINTVNILYGSRPVFCSHVPIIYKVNFDDIMPGEQGILMTTNDAEDVAKFVARVEEKGFTHLIVHCDEGISRSAAVAKAVAESRNLTEDTVNYMHAPNHNTHVYNFMKEALKKYL